MTLTTLPQVICEKAEGSDIPEIDRKKCTPNPRARHLVAHAHALLFWLTWLCVGTDTWCLKSSRWASLSTWCESASASPQRRLLHPYLRLPCQLSCTLCGLPLPRLSHGFGGRGGSKTARPPAGHLHFRRRAPALDRRGPDEPNVQGLQGAAPPCTIFGVGVHVWWYQQGFALLTALTPLCCLVRGLQDQDNFLYITYSGENTFGGCCVNVSTGNRC